MELVGGKSSILRSESFAEGRLRYFLTAADKNIDGLTGTTYGIRIESSLFGENENAGIEDVTPNLSYAEELFEAVHLYMVTPAQLSDVAADFLNEKYGCA